MICSTCLNADSSVCSDKYPLVSGLLHEGCTGCDCDHRSHLEDPPGSRAYIQSEE